MGAFAIGLIVLLLFGCASAPRQDDSPAALAGIAARRIAVVPMNLVIQLPQKLKSRTMMVSGAIDAHVAANGKTLVPIDYRTAQAIWIESTQAVLAEGGEKNFANAARAFTRNLATRFDFDALIIPSLYIQNAYIDPEYTARWDSANQRIMFDGQSKWEIEWPDLKTIEAASILVHVFLRDGEAVHERRTGLELIQHMVILREKQKGHDKRTWQPEDDDPALEDEDRIRAAIAHALSPFLQKRP